jgi:hypothetical protein
MAKLQTDSNIAKSKLIAVKKQLENYKHPPCGDFICIRREIWDRAWKEIIE